MKKILFISAAVLLLAACHKEPYPQDGDNEYLVYTSPGKDVNFKNYKTFDIADSLLVIGDKDKPVYSQSQNALALIQAYRINMEKAGFIYTHQIRMRISACRLHMSSTQRDMYYIIMIHIGGLTIRAIGLQDIGVTGQDTIILDLWSIHIRQMPLWRIS